MPKSTTTVSIRMDCQLKRDAEALFDELGLSLNSAITVFLRQAVRVRGIPFEIAAYQPNAETIAAMEEAERLATDPNVKKYDSVEELFKDLNQ